MITMANLLVTIKQSEEKLSINFQYLGSNGHLLRCLNLEIWKFLWIKTVSTPITSPLVHVCSALQAIIAFT